MINHPNDKQFELWLRSKEELDHDEAVDIKEHLDSCHLCKERLEILEAYYKDLECELSREPDARERAMASKIYQRRKQKALPSGSLIQTYEAPLEEHQQSLPVQFSNYVRRHPVGSAAATMGTFFLAVLLLIVQPWKEMNDNPIYAEVERNVLHVYNRDGESIWNMIVDGIPNGTTSDIGAIRSSSRLIRITDIDGDENNEVLLTGQGFSGEHTTDMLYSYNNDGTLRWKQSPPPPIQFGERSHSAVMNWKITDFFTFNQSGEPPRLFVTSNSSWFPSVLLELNPSNGEILQTYWHAGWIWATEIYQAENSENDRIVLGTTNNTYQKAALVVLNPDKITGHAPVKEIYQPEEVPRADEEHYLMFKPSLLHSLFSRHLYNEITRIQVTEDGGLLVRANESLKKLDERERVTVLYTLDKDFTVLEAHGSGIYDKLYSDLYNEGELDEPLTDEYWESLKGSVLYWDEANERFIRHGEIGE